MSFKQMCASGLEAWSGAVSFTYTVLLGEL